MPAKLLVEYQYLPPVYLFSTLYKNTHIIFEEYEFYQKMSFRNRCMLAGSEGIVQLSIPLLLGRSQKTLIAEVEIANRYRWQEQHWKTIESCYRKAPWFEYYAPELENYYRTPYSHLIKWNHDLFQWAVEKLGFDLNIGRTPNFRSSYDDQDIVDLRNTIIPKSYMKRLSNPYQQVFSNRTGFFPNLSILDLLFCQGKRAMGYFQNIYA